MPTVARAARILIVDDQTLFRTGLTSLLSEDERVEVVGQAVDGSDAVKQAIKLKPDVVLMDIKMPNLDGIEATRQIVEAVPGVKVLILTTFETDSQVIQALKAGASGYVLKDSSAAGIVSSIVAVMSGERVMASAVANRVLEMLTGTTTPKEFYDGLTNREIADRMHCSVATAKKYLQRILDKLGVSDRTQAAVEAVRAGLLD